MSKLLFNNWINARHKKQAQVQKYNQEFQNAKPFRHIQITNFLSPKFLQLLKDKLLQVPWEEKDSDLFSLYQTPELQSITEISLIQDFAELLKSYTFQKWILKIVNKEDSEEHKQVTLNNQIDLSAVTYAKHGYLLPHDDKLEGRKIAFILYLTSLKAKDGGALDLFNSTINPNYNKEDSKSHEQKFIPTDIAKSYLPKENALLFFEVTDDSWHQVAEVLKDTRRVAIGGWLHGN